MALRTPGPVLGRTRPRRLGGWWQRLAIVAALGVGGWLWVVEIGGDLSGRRRFSTRHGDEPAAPLVVAVAPPTPRQPPRQATRPAARTTRAGGPQLAATPSPRGSAGLEPPLDPVRRALIAASRDAVARGVRPTVGSVPDVRALRGSSADLVERALDQLGFPLRAAIIAHRVREPRRYGLAQRAGAGDIDADRVLDVAALGTFLEAFAERLAPQDEGRLRSGDLLLVVDPRRRGAAPAFAIVGEQTDAQGVSLLFTMDPRDRRARADRPASAYALRAAYRLTRARLEEARRLLGVGVQRSAGAAG